MLSISKTNKEIRIVGLQRSGNHALINWILAQAKGPCLFFNDVAPEHPLDERMLGAPACIPEPSGKYDMLLYSYEDRLLENVADAACYPQRPDRYAHAVESRYDILILRDPFNTFASRAFHQVVPTRRCTYLSGLTVPQLWTTYAREAAGKTRLLRHNKVVVNFNHWCRSRPYRQALAQRLGLEFTDSGFDEVTSFGGGSSFDATLYSKRAQAMALDQRWKNCRHNSDYQRLFDDPLMLTLTTQLFDLDDELLDYIEHELTPRTRRSSGWRRALAVALLPRLVALARRSPLIEKAYIALLRPLRQRFIARSY
jgi:hypothetical protein